ncbi:Tannase/feruloyl esterase [Whalleya microplaca]|nr:Tannase/feruloyl esterase [Whalleya microplaca]
MASSLATACHGATFSPSVFGAEILSLEANLVTNYSASVPDAYRSGAPSVELRNATFCNVTISYTHPGQDDNIWVETWLPAEDWNGRFQAVGGGGWVAGRFSLSYTAMAGALADGFATITTDAGLGAAEDASPWALNSPGNVNLYNLQNLASVSLNDEALIGKFLIKDFYGRYPDYSYWSGCSQGGRQGLMLAQRFPTAYDGIVALGPAIYWDEISSNLQWGQQVMNELNYYPYGCEIDAITAAAILACDGLDSVVDGVIAHTDACLATFDPFSLVGTDVSCAQVNGTKVKISEQAAIVVNSTWHGMTTANGDRVWYGVNPGTDLTGNSPKSYGQPGIAATSCNETGCVGASTVIGLQWLQLFVAKDPEKDFSNLTRAEFVDLVHAGKQQFSSLTETADPDLSRFRDAGGKMITVHGTVDNLIPTKGIEKYYNVVSDRLPDVHDFYRYFEAPGLGHCYGGVSGQPNKIFSQLRDWVESGRAPETSPIEIYVPGEKVHNRILCPYPKESQFDPACGDAAAAECWSCHQPSTSKRPHDRVEEL